MSNRSANEQDAFERAARLAATHGKGLSVVHRARLSRIIDGLRAYQGDRSDAAAVDDYLRQQMAGTPVAFSARLQAIAHQVRGIV